MMKPHLFLRLILFAVLLAPACAPATTEPAVTMPGNTPLVEVPSSTQEGSVAPTVELTATLPVEALPAATSRGPELHATDPTTVSLSAGQLHFVEFFRFT